MRYFESIYKNNPSNENTFAYIASLKSSGNFLEATNLNNQLLEKFPKNLILNITKAEILLSAQQYDRAELSIEEVLSLIHI